MRGRWYSNDYDDKSSKLASPSEKRALNEDVLGKNVDSPCESEDEADELTKSLDQLCRGFPQIDISQWSIRFQLSTFINDLQNGLTLSNALNRLQTMKAMMESKLTAFTSMGPGNASVPAYLASKGHEPKAVGKADESNIPIFHELVIPRDKREEGASGVSSTEGGNLMDDNDELRGLMQWDEALVDQDLLRSRIRKIHLLKDVSAKTKSRMVQTLMMGKFASDPLGRNSTKEEVRENNSSGDVVNNDSVAAYSRDSSVPPVVTDKDIQPSHHHSGVLGCPHYMRNCKLQCFKCEKWFACRFCHDEAVHSHAFERNKTKWILCMLCNHVQRPNSSECESCGQELALYFCKKCVLYDNDEVKDIYHCDGCGICRLGLGLGQDFFHCDSCQACLSIELQGNHRCIERSTMSNCPICGEYMFTSVKPVVYMSPCGHAIHQQCFSDHTRHSYKCPECQVTVLNMEAQFRIMDKEVEERPLPEPYCYWKCIIHCNDCAARSTCPYHILGLRCANCFSYNTLQLKLIKPGENGTTEDPEDTNRNSISAPPHLNSDDMRQQLLRANFQREIVQPLIDVEGHEYFRNMVDMDDYMDKYIDRQHSTNNTPGRSATLPTSSAQQPSLKILQDTHGLGAALAEKVKRFMADRPESPSWTEITKAFKIFMETSTKGLVSDDEDEQDDEDDDDYEADNNE